MALHKSRMRTGQKGVTLITVMLILIVITLLGISAMRMSLSSLTLATNSQVTNLLFQSADAGLTQLTDAVGRTPGTADVGGVLVDPVANIGTEYTFCVTPITSAGSRLSSGNCDTSKTDPTSSNQYTSGRNAVLTQVSIMQPKYREDWRGRDAAAAGPDAPVTVIVYSTSVIPAFGSADKDTINACLKLPNDDSGDDSSGVDTISVTDCLADSGAVFNTQVDEGQYGLQ